jgi:UDP-N-acetylmuramoyl-L-alanyl-D-glutamate--2,6-diaminopimelate ligase
MIKRCGSKFCYYVIMHNLKKIAKKILPAHAKQPIANAFHLVQAVGANVRYGFPTRTIKVIMVTGTNGKTTTVSIIGQMLTTAGYNVGINSTAYYSYGGKTVPRAGSRTLDDIFKLQAMFSAMKKAGCEYIVLEATSMGLEQNRLWGVPCDVAVMTNLTQDHLDYHGTMEKYAAAKGKLFARRPRVIVLNRDDEWFKFFDKYEAAEHKVTYGTEPGSTCQITDVKLRRDGSDVKLVFEKSQPLQVHTQLPGKFNVYNVAAAATAGYYLGLDAEKIAEGIAALHSVPGRLERVDQGQPFEVIVDYAHTPDALENVLSTLRNLTKGKLTIVFGATGDRDRSKRPVMGEIAVRLADRVFVTDEESYSEGPAAIREEIMAGVRKTKGGIAKTTEIADRREAINKAFKEARAGDTIVLTGMGHESSRNMGGKEIAWSDVGVARECLKELAGRH